MPPSSLASGKQASLCSVLNTNGDGSRVIKMQRQDVLLAAALTFQVPAAGVIRRLTSVDVGA
eukprot:scaffold10759_cov36-Phaeocystis_antarctica.AAC.1